MEVKYYYQMTIREIEIIFSRKRIFIWGKKVYRFSKIFLKREHNSFTGKKDSRENPDSVKTHTEKYKHVFFILQVHLKK